MEVVGGMIADANRPPRRLRKLRADPTNDHVLSSAGLLPQPHSALMKLRILESSIRMATVRARMPFRYGIVSMTSAPHAFVELLIETGGKTARGSADAPIASRTGRST